jgi:protein-disulfide isomerase
VLVTAVALATALIGASQVSAHQDAPAERAARATAPEKTAAFAGIEQRGNVLGSPNAPVTLVEYADLQCPYCAEWARTALPVVVDRYVRTGKVRIVFRGLAFIGPDSERALRVVVAAGRQDRMWDLVHGLYTSQGAENSGWATDGLVRAVAGQIAGLDADRLLADRWGRGVVPEMRSAAAAARAAGVSGTPSFEIGPTAGPLRLLRVNSLGPEGVAPAIEEALAR